MKEPQDLHGIPRSNTPPGVMEGSIEGPLPSTPSANLVDSSSQPTPCSEQTPTLKHQIAELEQEKIQLVELAINAKQRADEAEKRTAAAEAEVTAAKQRAQNRYTEKLHANNEVRHLREAIKERDSRRRAYVSKVQIYLSGLMDRVAQLESEKSVNDLASDSRAKITSLEAQLKEMQTRLSASQEEKATTKTQSDKIINDLKKVIVNHQSSITIAEKTKLSMKDAMEKLQAKLEDNEKLLKTREADLVQVYRAKLDKIESFWKSKVQSTENKVRELERQTEHAKKQAEAAKQQVESAMQQAESARRQLQMVVRTIRSNTGALNTQQQHHGNLSQQILYANKKRRLDSNGTASPNTNGFQPMRNQSFVSSPAVTAQNSMGGSNGVTALTYTPDNTKRSLEMAPTGGHVQYPSPRSNVSAGSTTPVLPLQPRYPSGLGVVPGQQNIVSTQPRRPMQLQQSSGPLPAQQQSNSFQQLNPNATMSHGPSCPQHPNGLSAALNMDFTQQSFQDIVQTPLNPFLCGNMQQVNGTNAAFPSNVQGNGVLSTFSNGNGMADLNTMVPQNEDLFGNNSLEIAGNINLPF